MKTPEPLPTELPASPSQDLQLDAAGALLQQLVQPFAMTEVETVGIFDALGRVLAHDVVSPLSVPPHDNSAMDGYAFDGRQLQPGTPLTLRVVGKAFAGQAWRASVGPGECVKIMTGAVMPAGLDTVVPQELVQRPACSTQQKQDGGAITVPAGVLRAGANRRFKGEDLQQGSVALARGTRLGPAALGLLASLGLAQVAVLRRLRVAYFSTGSEILSLGEAPREGAVYDSNRYTVFGLLTRLGVQVMDLGAVRDEPALLEAAFCQAAAQADAIITSGGVSTGEADHTRTLLQQLGDVAFWRLAMRPGRPMAVGRIRAGAAPGAAVQSAAPLQAKSASSPGADCASSYQKESSPAAHEALLFALPGNPVAVMVTFLALVRPALLQLMGSTQQAAPPLLQARSATALKKRPGRTEYQRTRIATAPDGALEAHALGNQGSGVLSSMVQAQGLIVLDPAQGNVAAGDTVKVLLFDGLV